MNFQISSVRRRIATLLVLIILVAVASVFLVTESGGATEWAKAVGERKWRFPRDHGSHPEYRTEWWYFTGNLKEERGGRFGYQLTFFRHGVRGTASIAENPWSLRDVYLAHFAITDGPGGRFLYSERASRAGPELAGARTDGLGVWLLDWQAQMNGSLIRLAARDRAMSLSLQLRPIKPVVLHGRNGRSEKGPLEGQASYYSSFTDLETEGFIQLPVAPLSLSRGEGFRTGHEKALPSHGRKGTKGENPLSLKGKSWFDHEFGSSQLAPNQQGWDWFSLHLSDGRDLMVYLLRRKDGSIEPASSGTLVDEKGSPRHLPLEDLSISVWDRWRSPRTQGIYPSRWRLRVPPAGIDLSLRPLLADQELVTEGSTGVAYWEGAVVGEGYSQGRKVSCEGYIELTGYAGSLGGTF